MEVSMDLEDLWRKLESENQNTNKNISLNNVFGFFGNVHYRLQAVFLAVHCIKPVMELWTLAAFSLLVVCGIWHVVYGENGEKCTAFSV